MKTSETIVELSGALIKAQISMTGAKKGAVNPFFKSKYSDLTSVMEAVSEPFASNDLCFVQGAEEQEGKIAVSTRIIHKSGEWIEAVTVLPATKNDAQGYGSAISYAKRYGLQALAGVPSVDDDGQAAVKKQSVKQVSQKFEKCTSMDDLATLWGELSKEEMHTYSQDKDKAKERLIKLEEK